ncbi:MAG: hypothetical protein RR449_01490 [Christensenella sp.]
MNNEVGVKEIMEISPTSNIPQTVQQAENWVIDENYVNQKIDDLNMGICVVIFAIAFVGGLIISKIFNWWKW